VAHHWPLHAPRTWQSRGLDTCPSGTLSPPCCPPLQLLGSGNGTYDPQANRGDLNLENPPFRDTATLPKGGWVVFRFNANNPGLWILHCHLLWCALLLLPALSAPCLPCLLGKAWRLTAVLQALLRPSVCYLPVRTCPPVDVLPALAVLAQLLACLRSMSHCRFRRMRAGTSGWARCWWLLRMLRALSSCSALPDSPTAPTHAPTTEPPGARRFVPC
jgi:hypothetical protein